MSERDKALTEAMGGKQDFFCMLEGEPIGDCVLQEDSPNYGGQCSNVPPVIKTSDCEYWELQFTDGATDFSTWRGFGVLWEFSIKQEWWYKFKVQYHPSKAAIRDQLIHPDRFADAVCEFLKTMP